MKIGLMGGSFDPPHNGHLALAQAAMAELSLDEVLWVPSFRTPGKRASRTPADQRLRMVRLAIESEPGMAVSDIEVTRGGDSYTVDTLQELRLVLPGDYWLVLGADSIDGFGNWKNPHRITELSRVAVAGRPGTDLQNSIAKLDQDLRGSIDLLDAPLKSVSSSMIREMAFKGEDFSHLVAPTVYGFIKENGLYKG